MTQNITTPFEFSIEIESLYIAHVFPNINKKRIAQLFEKLNLARISGIDFVSKIGKDAKPYNSAYIHIDYWFDNASARHFQEKIRSDAKESLLVYDDPWYWIVNENISPKKSLFIQNTEYENQLAVSASAAAAGDTEMEVEEELEDDYQDEEEYQFLQYEAVCQEIDAMEVEEENEFLKEIQVSAREFESNNIGIECYKLLIQADKRIISLLDENRRLKQELRKNINGY
jgi:hypothetical protein